MAMYGILDSMQESGETRAADVFVGQDLISAIIYGFIYTNFR